MYQEESDCRHKSDDNGSLRETTYEIADHPLIAAG